MVNSLAQTLGRRVVLCLTTLPTTPFQWYSVGGIALGTTLSAGIVATVTGFCHPVDDFHPPRYLWQIGKPLSAFLIPSLVEEIFWRGLWIPHPRTMGAFSVAAASAVQFPPGWALAATSAWIIHVFSHPVFGWTLWPRGRLVFQDSRFLFLAAIVLGGATASYIVSGGSVWAAAFTHGLPVALLRDCFGGEARLGFGASSDTTRRTLSSRDDSNMNQDESHGGDFEQEDVEGLLDEGSSRGNNPGGP